MSAVPTAAPQDILAAVAPRLAAAVSEQGGVSGSQEVSARMQVLPRVESGDPFPRLSAAVGMSGTDPERRADGGAAAPARESNGGESGPSSAEFKALRERVEALEADQEDDDNQDLVF